MTWLVQAYGLGLVYVPSSSASHLISLFKLTRSARSFAKHYLAQDSNSSSVDRSSALTLPRLPVYGSSPSAAVCDAHTVPFVALRVQLEWPACLQKHKPSTCSGTAIWHASVSRAHAATRGADTSISMSSGRGSRWVSKSVVSQQFPVRRFGVVLWRRLYRAARLFLVLFKHIAQISRSDITYYGRLSSGRYGPCLLRRRWA